MKRTSVIHWVLKCEQIATVSKIKNLKMKFLIIIASIAVLTHGRSLSKREAFQACFPFCGIAVPTGGVSQNCVGGNCAQNNAGGASATQSCQGAECKQNNAGVAAASQNCVGGKEEYIKE